MAQKYSFISSSGTPLKLDGVFVNRAGDKVELLCLKNKTNMIQHVISPKGTIFKPVFLKNTWYFYITYQTDQWYLFK